MPDYKVLSGQKTFLEGISMDVSVNIKICIIVAPKEGIEYDTGVNWKCMPFHYVMNPFLYLLSQLSYNFARGLIWNQVDHLRDAIVRIDF